MRCNVERRGSSSPLSHLDTTDWVGAEARCQSRLCQARLGASRADERRCSAGHPASLERFRYWLIERSQQGLASVG